MINLYKNTYRTKIKDNKILNPYLKIYLKIYRLRQVGKTILTSYQAHNRLKFNSKFNNFKNKITKQKIIQIPNILKIYNKNKNN